MEDHRALPAGGAFILFGDGIKGTIKMESHVGKGAFRVRAACVVFDFKEESKRKKLGKIAGIACLPEKSVL